MNNNQPSSPRLHAPKWVDILAPTVRAARIRGFVLITIIALLVFFGAVTPDEPVAFLIALAVVTSVFYVVLQIALYTRMRITIHERQIEQSRQKKN